MASRLIAVDGIEGGGKTTQLSFVRACLERAGHPVLVTREPGGTALGEEIRALLLGHREGGMALSTETLLMFAARSEHLERVIRPALAAGQWVLCDRFTDATYAYQGGGRGLAHDKIAVLEDWVQQGLQPDLTLLFDLPVAEGLERAGRRGAADRFEREQQAFFERARSVYLERARRWPERYRIVNAGRGMTEVRAQVEALLAGWLERIGG
ncbi:MAG TPA: dTMP kinase [Candidatus Competibacter sp.]|nr:dTMP kinase [Candidatus Competibacteraceae bacterium]HRE53238.1 dTMP kinase [Candidatus Competibacter sp.]HUM93338.1 dTMP kinase [Candidatus Competibacter sp.]